MVTRGRDNTFYSENKGGRRNGGKEEGREGGKGGRKRERRRVGIISLTLCTHPFSVGSTRHTPLGSNGFTTTREAPSVRVEEGE